MENASIAKLDCPELGIHKVEVCDWNVSQTAPDWDSWTFGKLNSLSTDPMPTLFWLFCQLSIICLPKHWICLWYDESWRHYDVLGTIGGSSIPPHIGWENVFLLACWYMSPLLSVEIMTQEGGIFLCFYQCETNGHYFQHVDMELGLVFRPATMKG